MSKTFFLNAIVLILAIIAGLLLSEFALRLGGHHPWQYETLDRVEPTMHQPDPELGWVNKAGIYTVPPYDPTGQPIKYTFYADGSRGTSLPLSVDSKNLITDNKIAELIIVGCSFSQGWAISDDETYAWLLQRSFANQRVFNYGTAGYSTFQSLLRLERTLPKLPAPKLVVYGFAGYHEGRNVAPAYWLELLSRFSKRSHVYVPFVSVDENGKLLRHPPQRYIRLPFDESSALVALIEKVSMKLLTRGRTLHQREITEKLILEMQKVSKLYGALFMLAIISGDSSTVEHYSNFAKQHNIPYASCAFPETDEMKVKGEGHPNAKMHALWARCITDAIVLNKLL